jgi:hypothetical protein
LIKGKIEGLATKERFKYRGSIFRGSTLKGISTIFERSMLTISRGDEVGSSGERANRSGTLEIAERGGDTTRELKRREGKKRERVSEKDWKADVRVNRVR